MSLTTLLLIKTLPSLSSALFYNGLFLENGNRTNPRHDLLEKEKKNTESSKGRKKEEFVLLEDVSMSYFPRGLMFSAC